MKKKEDRDRYYIAYPIPDMSIYVVGVPTEKASIKRELMIDTSLNHRKLVDFFYKRFV